MLGHANVGITLDLYSHATPTMHREAARTMDALLRAPEVVRTWSNCHRRGQLQSRRLVQRECLPSRPSSNRT